VSVNGKPLGRSDSSLPLINTMAPGATVRVSLLRKGSLKTAQVQCTHATQNVHALLATLDAAGDGRFAERETRAADLRQQLVPSSFLYDPLVGMRRVQRLLSGTWASATRATYWTLRLRELRGDPRGLAGVHPQYLDMIKTLLAPTSPELRFELALLAPCSPEHILGFPPVGEPHAIATAEPAVTRNTVNHGAASAASRTMKPRPRATVATRGPIDPDRQDSQMPMDSRRTASRCRSTGRSTNRQVQVVAAGSRRLVRMTKSRCKVIS
jgi:hypothetical protein